MKAAAIALGLWVASHSGWVGKRWLYIPVTLTEPRDHDPGAWICTWCGSKWKADRCGVGAALEHNKWLCWRLAELYREGVSKAATNGQ